MSGTDSTSTSLTAGRSIYLGLFLVTLATIAYQILLTRIFSVTIWYHFAFLAISISMLGMTVGAIAVYLMPETFSVEKVHRQLARSAFAFGLSIMASLLIHLSFPVSTDGSPASIASLVFTCVIIAVPFTASGICVALVLTSFARQVSSLYAVDLVGASIGCIVLIGLLGITDGPTAVFAVAFFALLGALCFAGSVESRALRGSIGIAVVATGLFVVGHTILVHRQQAIVRVVWAVSPRGPEPVPRPLHEEWNTHARIRVFGDTELRKRPFGWSMSPTLDRKWKTNELFLEIDSGALTVLTRFDGDLGKLGYLRYDITNLAHSLRSDADVLVVGAGGGRDILSALVFDQASVLGLEVNSSILDVTHRRFGDFTGHLDAHPKTRFEHDEARSFIARSKDHFDILQISLIDSWAATAAGAFVLTENSLYTVEAWKSFLEHLKPGGILTVTRYYFEKHPGAAYRMTSLAVAALEEMGVQSPRDHIALVRLPPNNRSAPTMGTILVSRDPFSAEDMAKLDRVVTDLRFRLVLTPEFALDEVFEGIAAGGDLDDLYASLPLDVSPSTDDRPFFFHMLRLRDVFNPALRGDQGIANFNIQAVIILGVLLLTVTVLTALFIVVPLVLRSRISSVREVAPWFLVFAGIGAGFMMIEISQMERLVVFLGHPIYALSVVLFTLLLSSGLGSFATQRIADEELAKAIPIRLGILLAALALFGFLTPAITASLGSASNPVRIAASIGVLAPIGFMMGMPFPMGIRAAASRPSTEDLTPWLWGMNGATSVLASVLAIVVAMNAGITVSFWTGFACYVVAVAGMLWAIRRRLGRP